MITLANIGSSWSRKKRLVVLLVLALLVTIFGVHIYCRFHIEGAYEDLQMGCDCHWIFKDGQIYMVTEEGRSLFGTYTRAGGRWVFRPLNGLGREFYMESSLLGVRWSDPQFKDGGQFLPRLCFSPYAFTLYRWHIRL